MDRRHETPDGEADENKDAKARRQKSFLSSMFNATAVIST